MKSFYLSDTSAGKVSLLQWKGQQEGDELKTFCGVGGKEDLCMDKGCG